jgi:hypothetical protein
MTKRTALAITLALTALGGGCSDDAAPSTGAAEARAAFVDVLAARSDSVGGGVPRTLEEHLPNVALQPPSGEPVPLPILVVIGEVTDVQPGRAFRDAPPNSGESATEVDFDDPTASSRTLHLEVRVDDAPVRVGVPISGAADPRVLIDGAKALGRVVLLLDRTTQAYPYDASLLRMIAEGRYLVTVDDDDTLHLPVLPLEDARAFQGELRSLDDLRRAAAEPTRLIPVEEPAPGVYVRAGDDPVPVG